MGDSMIDGLCLLMSLGFVIAGIFIGVILDEWTGSSILFLFAVVAFIFSLGGSPPGGSYTVYYCTRCHKQMKRLGKPPIVFKGKFKRFCPSCGNIVETNS